MRGAWRRAVVDRETGPENAGDAGALTLDLAPAFTASEGHFFPFTCPSSSENVGRSFEYRTLRPNSTATCGA